jgi:hypothetical protein
MENIKTESIEYDLREQEEIEESKLSQKKSLPNLNP